MVKWLAIGAAVSLAWTNAAGAQLKRLALSEHVNATHARAPDFRMSQLPPVAGPYQFSGGMIVSRDVAPNATLGLGLARVSGRKQGGGDFRIGGTPSRRKPAVTFLLHF